MHGVGGKIDLLHRTCHPTSISWSAGVSFGVRVIKPQLAIAMAVYAFARRWIAVIAATT
jgi:hypothetical protein